MQLAYAESVSDLRKIITFKVDFDTFLAKRRGGETAKTRCPRAEHGASGRLSSALPTLVSAAWSLSRANASRCQGRPPSVDGR